MLKRRIIKFKGLMAHWMHRLVFNYSSAHPHLFRNYPSSAQISLFYSFRDGSEQRLQQIHFPEDKNSWQARSSPRAYRLACDTQAQLRADSHLEKELQVFNQGFPRTKSRKKNVVSLRVLRMFLKIKRPAVHGRCTSFCAPKQTLYRELNIHWSRKYDSNGMQLKLVEILLY